MYSKIRSQEQTGSSDQESTSLLGLLDPGVNRERPGSALSEDSGNCDNGASSGTDDEGDLADDSGAITKIRACAMQLWQMSKTMQRNKHSYDLLNNNGTQRERVSSADSDDDDEDYVTGGSSSISSDSDSKLTTVAEKCDSLVNELSCLNMESESPKKMNCRQKLGIGHYLRQTFTVSSSQSSAANEEARKVTRPCWSDFPPSKAKRAPRNMTYVNV